MTSQDYNAIAATILRLDVTPEVRAHVAVRFATTLQNTNPLFDEDRFLAAARGESYAVQVPLPKSRAPLGVPYKFVCERCGKTATKKLGDVIKDGDGHKHAGCRALDNERILDRMRDSVGQTFDATRLLFSSECMKKPGTPYCPQPTTCATAVVRNPATQRYLITFGHPGFNSTANNRSGYFSFSLAAAAIKRLTKGAK